MDVAQKMLVTCSARVGSESTKVLIPAATGQRGGRRKEAYRAVAGGYSLGGKKIGA